MTDVIEIMARAMCDGDWDAADFNETPSGEEPEEMRDHWRDRAIDALAALEENGMVVETRATIDAAHVVVDGLRSVILDLQKRNPGLVDEALEKFGVVLL